VRQVVSMVRWVDEEESLVADGYTRFLEVGPGSVLSGLWKAFNRELPCLAAGKLEDIEKLEG
jgi:[acyl-carrier-protein] S-malonyltransferase